MPRRARFFRPTLLAGTLVVAGLAAADAPNAEPIEITQIAVPLDISNRARETVGDLTFMGGFRLTSPHPDFGGWSGLWVSPDGQRMVAVGDRGHWLTANTTFSVDGHFQGIHDAKIIPMLNTSGIPVEPPWADAESIAALAGGFLVSFERAHRFWWYSARTPEELGVAIPAAYFHPDEMHSAPTNGGVEALTELDGSTLVAFAENLKRGESIAGWTFDGEKSESQVSYAAQDRYVPTGAATLPSGDVLILERRFDLIGFRSRVVRLERDALQSGATVEPTEIATLTRPLAIENYEGIATVDTPQGTLVFLISDNNFTALQRTLLMVFRIDP
jgi:hypothetical protein